MLTGSCLCGGIQYQIDGELGQAMVCHYGKCRKSNGSAFAVNAAVKVDEFRLLKGQELVGEFESTPGYSAPSVKTVARRCTAGGHRCRIFTGCVSARSILMSR